MTLALALAGKVIDGTYEELKKKNPLYFAHALNYHVGFQNLF